MLFLLYETEKTNSSDKNAHEMKLYTLLATHVYIGVCVSLLENENCKIVENVKFFLDNDKVSIVC